MSGMENIGVATYDGHKGGEAPRKVLISGKEYRVRNLLESARVRRADGSGEEEHFKVDLEGFGEAKVIYHHCFDGWTLEEKRAPKTFSEQFVERRD